MKLRIWLRKNLGSMRLIDRKFLIGLLTSESGSKSRSLSKRLLN